MDNWITTKEAAKIIQCNQGHISRLFHAERLIGKFLTPRLLLIDRASAESYREYGGIYANSSVGRAFKLKPIERSQPYHQKEHTQ